MARDFFCNYVLFAPNHISTTKKVGRGKGTSCGIIATKFTITFTKNMLHFLFRCIMYTFWIRLGLVPLLVKKMKIIAI